jgi:hypothetical protein
MLGHGEGADVAGFVGDVVVVQDHALGVAGEHNVFVAFGDDLGLQVYSGARPAQAVPPAVIDEVAVGQTAQGGGVRRFRWRWQGDARAGVAWNSASVVPPACGTGGGT